MGLPPSSVMSFASSWCCERIRAATSWSSFAFSSPGILRQAGCGRFAPSVALVPSPLIRRVIRHDRNLIGFSLAVPHNKSHAIKKEALQKLASPAELGGRELPGPSAILLVRPGADALATKTREALLLQY